MAGGAARPLSDGALDTTLDGRLVSIEILDVSREVKIDDLPEPHVVTRVLDLLAVRCPAAWETACPGAGGGDRRIR